MGASGFVGNRAVELFHAEETITVRPIVHSAASVQRLTHKADYRIANSFDQASLEAAFEGCDVVIHSILGSAGLIRGSITPTYKAAQKVGVRRVIYLSSMIVHTSAPVPGTTESTPLIEKQPFLTHTAKIYAERKLLQLRQSGSVEVVIFRPGIVFGPRSRWITELADQLVHGTAYFINGGQGICNTVYVDNLVHAMRLALTQPNADGEAFFVGDRELITWFNFYHPFAEYLGINPDQIPLVDVPQFTHSWKQQALGSVWNSTVIQKLIASIPNDFKQVAKHTLSKKEPRSGELTESAASNFERQPVVNEMMAILQQSQYKLPFTKAEEILGYEPLVSFHEGCQRSIEWLASRNFIHSPVKN